MFFVSICTLVTFTACKLTDSDSTSGANFDASGNLKLVSPYVEFNKYSEGEVIDENSGSFTWKLQYYYSGSNKDYLKNINFDQDYLFANFFKDSEFKEIINLKPTKGASVGSNYFINGTDLNSSDKLYSPVFEIDGNNISFPSFEVVVDGNYYTFKVSLNKSYLERMTNQEISNNMFYDGTTTLLKNIFKDKSYDYENKKWKDNDNDGKADEYGSLFTFEYRTGKNTNGEFVECPKGLMSYYVNNFGEFCIRFNPQLQAGSVNRYLKVKSLAISDTSKFEQSDVRGNSNYSSTVAFEAYAVSFEVYSPNSATLDYGGLDYDHDQYYFAYEKTYYDSYAKKDVIKNLTGYFPEGRKIVVERTSPYADDYNYAFQNWTINTKAEYSLADNEKYPSKINALTTKTGSNIISDETKSLSDAFQVVESYRNVLDLKYYEKSEIGVTEIQKKEGNSKLLLYTYSPVHTRTGADAETKIHDEIVVTSHSTINGYKFYANYAKVRGFLASGSFFAGDNFFTTGDQNLSEVSIFLFYKIYEADGTSKYNSTQLAVSVGETTGKKSHDELFSSSNNYNNACYPSGITYTIDGSYFKVEGLENTDFIIFQKEGSSRLTDENKPYSFYSQYLKEINAMGSTFKGLDLVVNDKLISDRQDIGIIGTQYAENSNIQINLYRVLDSKGTTEGLSSTYLDLLKNTDVSYEIIKSVSSVEDKDGFITTNVILSLILPSNATLTGYNVETVQTTSKLFFSTTKGSKTVQYVSFLKYDETTMDEYVVDIDGVKPDDNAKTLPVYKISKNPISKESVNKYSSQIVYYNGTLYTLDHEEVGGYMATSDSNRVYFYKANSTTYLIKENDAWYTLIYEKKALTPEYSLDNGETTYKIGGTQVFEQRNSSTVSTIAKAYGTDMKFINPNNTSESQKVYVYYDVSQVGKNLFYISPIGKQTLITSKNTTTGSESTTVEDDLYFGQISNFNTLKNNGSIMLGSDILSLNSDYAKAFREAIGSKLILNCYYYIKDLESPVELYFKQYISNDETTEDQAVYKYYDENGNEYTGDVCQGYDVGEDGIINGYTTSIILRNPQGVIVDSDTYKYFAGFETTSGEALGNAHTYLKSNNYTSASEKTSSEFIFNGATYEKTEGSVDSDGYGSGLKYKKKTTDSSTSTTYALAKETTIGISDSTNTLKRLITLYELNSDGKFISYSLYFNDSKYYKIVGSTYVNYKDSSGVVQSDKFYVYENNPLTLSTLSSDFDIYSTESNKNKEVEYQKLITVNSTGESWQRVYKGTTSTKIKVTYYKQFIVNSFVEYNSSGEVLNTYYPVVIDSVKDPAGNKQLISQTTANSTTLDNFLGIVKNTSGQVTEYKKLYFEKDTKSFVNYEDTLIRRAQTTSGNEDVTVLGKYITTNDASSPKIYPSFSSFLTFTEDETFILDRNSDGEINYYSMDYTTKKNVIEGFPGFSLLAGIPYPNPVLTFQVRHKACETPTINISLDISNGYYVEVMGTNIATDETNLIRDFTTYSFKDTVENLLQNDYIDNAYWVLERSTFNTVSALVETNDANNYDEIIDGKKYCYYMYTTEIDQNNNVIKTSSPLTIQNIGLNENDKNLYASGYVGVDNTYYKNLYMLYTDRGVKKIKKITTDDVIVWKSSSSVLTSVPTFDIHTYSQGLDGIIYFNSGSYNDDNIICNGLSGITAGSTQSSSGFYDYSEVLIGGVTYAYRTLSSQMNNSDNMSGYQFDKMINVLNAYNSTEAYFLTGKESAVLVASPIVKIADDAGNSFVYRFKEWKVYSRYNSEVLYYNRGVTENLTDRYNAILRFSSSNAGYFVMFPVYERVFDIDIGSAILDGAINQGGSINVSYKDGEESDIENLYDDNLYFINYEKISYGDKEGYYYGNLKGYPFLYFTGEFVEDKNDVKQPVFDILDNVYVVELSSKLSSTYTTETNVDVPLFFQIKGTQVNYFNIISNFESGKPGIVLLQNYNGQYTYFNFEKTTYKFEDDDGFYLKDKSDPVKFYEIMNTSFTADFFFDEITESSINTSVPLHYDTTTQTFNVLDVKGNSTFGSDFVLSLIAFNVNQNPSLFSSIDAILALFKNLNGLTYDENSIWITALKNIGDNGLTINNDKIKEINTYLGDMIATYSINKFTVIKKITNPYVNGLYVSRFGSLTAGELATDDDGNIYSSQQFKTAYIDRDSYVELQAIADNGYRFEGWYKCEYDEENGFWFTTDEKVENSKNIYSDEIIQAYYNKYIGKYYYITNYYDVTDYSDDGTELVYVYYLDSDKTEPAVVPDRMLDKVRGYFINEGSEKNPNYVQVYKRSGGLLDESYYYDSAFTRPVDKTDYDVEEKTYIECIRKLDYGVDGVFYYLSNVGIYFNEENGKYYRDMTTGNIVVSGDKIIIKNLHSNVRFVAKFIETYNQYIFAEDEDSTGISIEAVYYSNSSQKYDSEGNVIIRTDIDGNNRTSSSEGSDYIQNSLDQNLFKLYEDETKSGLLDTRINADGNYISQSYNYLTGKYETNNNHKTLYTLVNTGFGSTASTYRVNKDDPTLNGKLNLQSMYFDVDTTVTIVVRVKAEFELSVHSLGVNSKYTINPIFYPTEEYIEANQKADSDKKVDYLYYILQLTYNRDPQNEYRGYIVHPNRGENMAYDALVGNYIDVYGSYFDYYDNNGDQIEYTESNSRTKTTEKTKIKLAYSYLNKVCDNAGIKSSVANTWYSNLEDALNDLSKKMGNPELLKVDHIKSKSTGETLKETNKIITVLKEIFKDVKPTSDDAGINNVLIQNGQRNFINLSTIPVYNYTVQAIVIDSEGDSIQKDSTTGKVILPSSNYEDNKITYPTLQNSLYTTGGTGGKTYLGSGSNIRKEYFYKQYSDVSSSYTTLKFENYISGIDYAGKSNSDEGNESLLEDLVFVQNSIILFDGIKNAPAKDGETYLFVGWYEQKYNRDTETWSDLVFMSNDKDQPYVSLATADTVIVAIYKRAVNVTFTFNQNEIAFEMSNALVDSAGKRLEITTTDNVVEMKGTFFFDAEIEAIFSPAGGYRFDGFEYDYSEGASGSNVNGTVFDKLSFANYNHSSSKFEDCSSSSVAILNSILKVTFKLNEILRTGDKAVQATNLSLQIKTKKLTLVYFTVENFYVNDKDANITHKFMGYDFALVQKNSSTEKVLFRTEKGNLKESGKDNANNNIVYDIDYTLSVYGYFDSEITDSLVLLTLKYEDNSTEENTIKHWFINRDTSTDYYTTNDKYFNNLSYDGTFASSYNDKVVNNFEIKFEYDENKSDNNNNKLNSTSSFNLSKNNSVYFAQAVISTETTSLLKVSHSLVESINDVGNKNKGTKLTDGNITILTYSGSIDSEGGATGNSAELIPMQYSEKFSAGTKIDLDVSSSFFIYNGELYVFVGWFSENVTTGNLTLISLSNSISNQKANGSYVARFARVSKIDSSSITDADITFVGTQTVKINSSSTADIQVFGELDNVSWNGSVFAVDTNAKKLQYAFIGSSLRFTITPRSNTVIHSCSVSGDTSVSISYTEEVNSSNSNAIDYTVESLPSNTSVSVRATVQKGYTLKIKQSLYDNFNMTGDSTALSGCVSVTIGSNSSFDATDSEFVVEPGKTLKLTATSSKYYFIGFFVENNIVSLSGNKYLSEYSTAITEDTIIEARYTKYNYVAVTNTLQGTNTSISASFGFELSYTDPKTAETRRLTRTNELMKVPAGILATIQISFTGSDLYNFIGLKTIDFNGNIKKSISSNTRTQMTLDLSYCSANNAGGILTGDEEDFIYVSAVYQKTTVLKVVKNVEISSVSQTYFSSGTDKNLSEEQMNSLFNVIVSYVDSYGENRIVTLNSVNELSNIRIKKGSTVKITPLISSVVSHRYTVYDFEFKYDSNSHKDVVTENSDGSFSFTCDENNSKMSSLEFTVYFKPCKSVTISKELAGSSLSKSNVTVEYNFVNSNNANDSGVLSTTSETEINIKEGGNFTLTAKVSDADKYTFIGWFVDGKKISENKTISSVPSSSNYESALQTANFVVAKFMETITLDVVREFYTIDSSTAKDVTASSFDSKFGNIYVVADFVNADGLTHTVKKMTLSEIRSSTNLKIIAGTKISVFAEQSSDYLLKEFKFDVGTYSNYYSPDMDGENLLSDGYSLVTSNNISENLTIHVAFEEFYPITYLISTTNSDSKNENGIEIEKPITHVSKSKASSSDGSTFEISFDAIVHEGFVVDSIEFNGNKVEFSVKNKTYSLNVSKSDINESNNILKINVKENLKINVYLAFDDITDASKVDSVGNASVTINGSGYSFGFSSGTILASKADIKALEKVTITVPGNVGDYTFDGFYLYDGYSAVSSVAPITFNSTFEFLANSTLSVVAKFYSNKTPSSTNTRFVDDNGSSNFVGWFARVNSTSSSFKDILISTNYGDGSSLDGKFDIVVAKYQTTTSSSQTIEISGDYAKFGSALIYVHSSSLSNVSISGTSTNLTVTNAESLDVEFVSEKGFKVASKNDFDCKIEKKYFNIKVQVEMNKVIKNNVSDAESASTLEIEDNTISANVTIKITGSTNSSVLANVLQNNIDQTFTSKTLTSSDSEINFAELQSGSTINLSFDLAIFEKFNGFKITENGTSRIVTTRSLDYLVSNSFGTVTIEVLFDNAFISTITENDSTKGTASLYDEKTGETVLKVQAYDGYEISAIYASEVSSGSYVGWKNILSSEEDAKSLLGNDFVKNATVSENDSYDNNYMTACEITFTALKNIAFKVEYKRVSKVNFYVYAGGTVEVVSKYVNDSPLTLEKIESYDIIDKLENQEIKDAYSFDKFSYLGEEITSETQIELTDGIINIEVSMNKAYKLKFTIDIEDSGIEFGVPTEGLNVKFEGATIATYGGESQLINYKLSNLTKVIALDSKNFYDFVGFYSKGLLISSASSYIFTASDILENLQETTIDGETVYVVNVKFKVRFQTLTIKKDYNFAGVNLSLSYDGTTLSPSLDSYNYINVEGLGNIAYRERIGTDENTYFEISYPHSVLLEAKKITIYQDATTNSTDPYRTFVGVTQFHEICVDDEYYRFDNFYGENNLPIGTKYSNSLQIDLNDYAIDKTIIAKMIKLYQIDYVYDCSDSNIKISIDFLRLDSNGSLKYTTVASSCNESTVQNALISYRAEEGTTIRVSVDFSDASTEIASNFTSVLVSASNALSKIGSQTINTYGWENHIKNNNYIPVSKFLSGTNAFSSLVFNGKASFNFKPNQNLSFIADFGYGTDAISNSTFTIISVLWTIDNNILKYTLDKATSTIDGNGFSFTSTNLNGSEYEAKKVEFNINTINVLDPTELLNATLMEFLKKNYYEYSNFKNSGNQFSHHIVLNTYSEIEATSSKIVKSDYGVQISTFDKGIPTLTVTSTKNALNSSNIASSSNKGRVTTTVSVQPIDEYFFKGFAIVSSNYESTYNIKQFGGETAIATTEQYNFIKHETEYVAGKASKYSATVTISGDSKIVAIFEPTVYTITLNTYKFFEDNKNEKYSDDREKLVEKSSDINAYGDIDKDKYQTTESATIEGSLIALAGESIKITSVSYQYSQFVGFTGTEGIKFGFDVGEGISSNSDEIKQVFNKTEDVEYTNNLQIYLDEEDETNKNYKYFAGSLKEYNISPGYLEDDFGITYVSSSARNNFYALNVSQSFTLNMFYTNLSYRLIIDLSETESTINYGENSITSVSYLAYSEDYVSWQKYQTNGYDDLSEFTNETFVNPSAGTYSITTNYGTNSKNDVDNNYTIKIENNDPYIYVINDSSDNYIGYPTKISLELVEMRDSSDSPVKIKDLFYKGTTVRVKIAKANGDKFGYNGSCLYLQGYSDDSVGGDVGDLKKYSFDYNVSEKTDDGRPTLRNITNYVSTSGTLKKNLFVININGQDPINSESIKNSNLEIDYEKQTIRVIYKIVASDVGFPSVSIVMFDSSEKKTSSKADLLESINKVQIKNNTKTENKQTKSETSASNITSINGFNLALFESDAQFNDPDFKLGNIDVNLNLIWQTTAKEVVANVELSSNGEAKTYTLTGVKSDKVDRTISYESRGCCLDATNHSGQHVRAHENEIDAYFIIIVKNGYTLIELLQKFVEDKYLDEATVGTAMTYLLKSPFGIVDGYGTLKSSGSSQIGNGAVGSLMSGEDQRSDTFTQVNNAINKYYGTSNVDYFASTFSYRVVDAFELYQNEINGNFFNNAANTNDLVVTQCVLQEHEEPQDNHYGGWLHWLWTADKGYAYYNSATGSFNMEHDNGSYSAKYHNNAERAEMDTTSTTKSGSRTFWDKVVGTFNSSKSFAGTYNRFITIGYAPTDEDFIDNENIISTVTIDNSPKYQILTREYDYDPMPIVNALTGMITYVAPVFLTLIPGVGPFLGAAYVAIAIGSAIWSICDPDVKFIYDYWANIY